MSAAAAFTSCYSDLKVEAGHTKNFPTTDHNHFMRLATASAPFSVACLLPSAKSCLQLNDRKT